MAQGDHMNWKNPCFLQAVLRLRNFCKEADRRERGGNAFKIQ
jgi:hypothetical protein